MISLVALSLVLAMVESVVSPETALGYARLRIFYALAADKSAMLKSYEGNLEMVNGGCLAARGLAGLS